MKRTGVVFLDVGGTLGTVDSELKLHPFDSTPALLTCLRKTLGLRLGVISNTPTQMDSAALKNLLEKAGLAQFFEANLIVASTDAHASKPDVAIYSFAAQQAGVPPRECLYIGEDAGEVDGAIRAEMAGILKPILP